MKCKKCGDDLLDKAKSSANWTRYHAVCPKCGMRVDVDQLMAATQKKKAGS